MKNKIARDIIITSSVITLASMVSIVALKADTVVKIEDLCKASGELAGKAAGLRYEGVLKDRLIDEDDSLSVKYIINRVYEGSIEGVSKDLVVDTYTIEVHNECLETNGFYKTE